MPLYSKDIQKHPLSYFFKNSKQQSNFYRIDQKTFGQKLFQQLAYNVDR